MDAKESYLALQAHLRDARHHLNAGQPASAREALEAALTLDPACLAAQVLFQQIGPTSSQPNDRHFAQAPRASDGLSVSAGRLEERVRRRRIEGRTALARASLVAGDLAAARAAVDEIKDLDPQCEEVALLEAQLSEPIRHAVALPDVEPSVPELLLTMAEPSVAELPLAIPEPPLSTADLPSLVVDRPARLAERFERTRSSKGARLAAAAAFMFVVLSVWSIERLPAPASQPAPQARAIPIEQPQLELPAAPQSTGAATIEPSVETRGAPTPEEPPAPAPPPPVRISPELLPAAPVRTESIDTPFQVASRPAVPTLPPVQWPPPEPAAVATSPPIAVAPPIAAPPPAVAAPPPVAPSPPSEATAAVAPSPPVAPPATVESTGSTVESTGRSTIAKSTIDDSAAPAPAASLGTAAIPEEQSTRQIRILLQGYRQAYGQLSAASARQVWPGVNEAALARAFAGLETQTLVFETCHIQVRETLATATCRGRARYVPKIGSRYERVEPRDWSFTFRRRGAQWEIESATARRP